MPTGELFDQRHLIALYQRGAINELPIELGPMPMFNLGSSIEGDLRRWNIIDSAGELSPQAEELFSGITSYEWAVWGIVLLYNERINIISELPEELLQCGVQYAVRDVPRVTFLVGYREGRFSTATLSSGRLAIAADPARSTDPDRLNAMAGEIIKAIVDPHDAWPPYPIDEFSIPAATADALKKDRDKDIDEVVDGTREGLAGAGIVRTTVDQLSELLRQDNVAIAQVALTRRTPQGKKTANHSAVGIMFFTGERTGAVVSYPTRGMDGRQWITYEPATPAALGRAIGKLHDDLAATSPADIRLK